MRIGVMSQAITSPRATVDDLVAEARKAEADGYGIFAMPNVFGHDAIGALTVVGRETGRIALATAVVPMHPRHPLAIAQQALTAQAASRGRFSLGIGLSHKVVIENMLGLSYTKHAAYTREYLQVLKPLLSGQPVSHQGEFFNVNAQLQAGGAGDVPVLVAALGPRMLKVTGELADGTITWMTGMKTLEGFTVPTIRAAAEAAGRPQPRVVAGFPVALTRDADAAREVAGKMFAMYGTLPSYRAMLDREGLESPGDVTIAGDEATLRAELARLRDAGVTDFGASLFPADDGAIERTAEFLRGEL
jgi:5,10-methylenetetrahydromethanopterin reductase